ncbi:MAG: hypothetical protein ACK4Z4_10115, partial [Ferrovibrio sp.]
CRRIARICASVYLLVFIQNLLVHLGEKILLMQPLTFGGDYQTAAAMHLAAVSLSVGLLNAAAMTY